MKTSLLALGLLLLAVVPAAAQPLDSESPPDETDTTLSAWPFFQDILGADKIKSRYYALSLLPEVFGKARPDLSDLRIADVNGVRVPYAMRNLRSRHERIVVPIVRQFDEGVNEAKRYAQVNLELGDPGPQGYNEIELNTSGMDFRRRAQVLASKDAQLGDPVAFIDKFLVRYQVESRLLNLRVLQFSAQRSRYLQVRVYADPLADKETPKIESVVVRRTISIPGTYGPWTPAQLEPRQLIRTEGGPGSAWFITAGEPLPWEQLRFRTRDEEVERPFRIQIANPDQPRQEIGGVDWRWRKEQDVRYLEAEFPETYATRLRLVITDYANPPLNLESVDFRFPVRQLVFAFPADKKLQPPLRLYYGNAAASAPNYDIQRRLPEAIVPAPAPVTLGPRDANTAWRPPPLTLHERMPWIIYLVLGVACAALAGILAVLARTVLRQSRN